MINPPTDRFNEVIDTALQSEPMLTPPVFLRLRIDQRVKIAALRDHEAVRFRRTILAAGLFFLSLLAMAACLVCYTDLYVVVSRGISGGKGQFDAYAMAWRMSCSGYGGAYSLVASLMLAVGTLLLGLLPARRRLASR
jgi:hypothetical protein